MENYIFFWVLYNEYYRSIIEHRIFSPPLPNLSTSRLTFVTYSRSLTLTTLVSWQVDSPHAHPALNSGFNFSWTSNPVKAHFALLFHSHLCGKNKKCLCDEGQVERGMSTPIFRVDSRYATHTHPLHFGSYHVFTPDSYRQVQTLTRDWLRQW